MTLYIPHSIFHLARLLYVRPETFGPYYVCTTKFNLLKTKTVIRYIQFVHHRKHLVLWLARSIDERSKCKWLLIVRSIRNKYIHYVAKMGSF